MSTRVKNYFNNNWHHIREQWVEGLKSKKMNLGVRTNNRLKSFFSHLKKSLIQRGSLKEVIKWYMLCQSTLKSERSHRLLQTLSKVLCQPVSPEEEPYRKFLTPYCFRVIQDQLKTIPQGTRDVTATDCKCPFFTSMRIPCKHILANRLINNLDAFCPKLVSIRWAATYYKSKAQEAPARPRLGISTQLTGPKDRLTYNRKGQIQEGREPVDGAAECYVAV